MAKTRITTEEIPNNKRKYLTTYDIPETITTIEDYAFYDCLQLTNIDLPENLESIGAGAFQDCISLPSIKIPSKIKSISGFTFMDCNSLVDVDLGNVTDLGQYSFSDCKKLEKITIPDTVQYIYSAAFYECHNLKHVTLSKNLLLLDDFAFIGCGFSSIDLPESLSVIGRGCFQECRNLTYIKIPWKVSAIEAHTFMECPKLETIILPKYLKSIEPDAFYGIKAYATIYYEGSKEEWQKIEKIGSLPSTIRVVFNWSEVDDGLLVEDKFDDLAAISDIDDIDVILSWIDLAREKGFDIVKTQEGYRLRRYKWIVGDPKVIEIPRGVDIIGSEVFAWKNIEKIYLPDTVKQIRTRAFKNCNEINTVGIDNIDQWFNTDFAIDSGNPCDICDLRKPGVDLILWDTGEVLTEIKIPDRVFFFRPNLFSYQKSLHKIILNDNLTQIPVGAFRGCKNLDTIIWGNNIQKIWDQAFWYCKSLTDVSLPDGIKEIGSEAFYCSGLKNITLPRSLEIIRMNAFSYTDLTHVYYKGTSEEWENLKKHIEPGNDELLNANIICLGDNTNESMKSKKRKSKLIETKIDDLAEISDINDIELPTAENIDFAFNSDLVDEIANRFCGTSPVSGNWETEDLFLRDTIAHELDITEDQANKIMVDYLGFPAEEFAYDILDAISWIYDHQSLYEDFCNFFGYEYDEETGEMDNIPDLITVIDWLSSYYEEAYEDFKKHFHLGDNTLHESLVETGKIEKEPIARKSKLLETFMSDVSDISDISDIDVDAEYYDPNILNIKKTTLLRCLNKDIVDIKIPNFITEIGVWAFSYCSSLTSITIPDTVTSIGNSAFYECSSLPSIKIPNSVTSIEGYAFYGCRNLTSITIPNSVTNIWNYAFYGCRNLTSITIPNSVIRIGDSAFSYCRNLTSIEIPNSVINIGDSAFIRCESLESIKISNNVKSIRNSTFQYCSSLKSIEIPNSVTSIEAYAFFDCDSLKDIYYEGTQEQWNQIEIDETGNWNLLYDVNIHYNSTMNESLYEKLIKKGSKWQVQSEKGRNMGTYNTKEEAKKRLQQIEYFKHMNEAIEKHDTLNPKIFDENNHLKPEVRDKILNIVDQFVTGLQEDGVKMNIKDIVIVGSNCSYNYNEFSDIDVHIKVDVDSLECPDNLYPLLYSAYRSIFNSKFDIDFYGIPVELYVETL